MSLDADRASLSLLNERDLRHPAASALRDGLKAKRGGEYGRASELYHSALDLARVAKQAVLEACAHLNLGNLYRALGDYETAWAHYGSSGKIASALGRNDLQAQVAMAMAGVAWQRGDYDTALDGYEEARAVFQALGLTGPAASALHNIGSVYEALQIHEVALEKYRKVLAECDDSDLHLRAQAHCQIGACLVAQGLAVRAKQSLSEALRLARLANNKESLAFALHNLGLAHLALGERRDGLNLVRLALHTRLEMSVAAPTHRLRVASRQPCLRSLRVLVSELRDDGNWQEAINAVELLRGRETLEARRRRSVDRARAGETEAETLVATRGRLRDLIDTIEAYPFQTGSDERPLLGKALDEYHASLLLLARLEGAQEANGPASADPLAENPADTLLKVPADSTALLLAFLPIEDSSGLALVTAVGGNARMHDVSGPVDGLSTWNETQSEVLERLSRGAAEQARTLLTELVEELSERLALDRPPADQLGSGISRITIVPWDVLHDLPLEAVRLGGCPLGLRWPVERAFSLGTRASGIRSGRHGGRALVIADPTRGMEVDPNSWGLLTADCSLPAASMEGAELAAILKAAGWDVDILAPEDCSMDRVLTLLAESRHSLIHFACHAIYDPYDDESSGLLLRASNRTEPALLTAEILQRSAALHGAPLVAVSACRSGGLAMQPGDEPSGLLRALLIAGASRILATGWPVTDATAAKFMSAFYRTYATGSAAAEAGLSGRLAVYRGGTTASLAHTDLGNVEDWAAFRLFVSSYSADP